MNEEVSQFSVVLCLYREESACCLPVLSLLPCCYQYRTLYKTNYMLFLSMWNFVTHSDREERGLEFVNEVLNRIFDHKTEEVRRGEENCMARGCDGLGV